MRERRRRLDTVRPKIVKVRHACSRQDKTLTRRSMGSGFGPSRNSNIAPSSSVKKIQQLKMEAKVTSTRRQPPSSFAAASCKARSTFGAAVAFATVGKTVTGKQRTALPSAKKVASTARKRAMARETKKGSSANVQMRLKMLGKRSS